MSAPSQQTTVISADSGSIWSNWREFVEYRDLFLFWTWRSVKIRYAQSVLGIGWAIIQPLFSMLIFTIIFGNLAKISSDGVPYAIFSLAGLVPWTFFADGVNESTGSLIQNANMISKIYFPRLILPIAAVVAKLVDFVVAMTLLALLMLYYQVTPNWSAIAIPLLVLLAMISSAGIGIGLAAMAIQYRDVKYGITFIVQLLMYAAPVVYPASLIPAKWQYLYGLNPMVGVIEGFRASLLSTRPMPWDLIAIGYVVGTLLLFGAMIYFRSKERLFADVA